MNPSPGKLLVVDDDRSIRQALLATLRAMGFEVTEASSGETALEKIRTDRYDVALLDINMPGMGGIKACRELRRLLPRLGILMVTVRDGEEDKIAALDAGADDYVTKPFHVRELAARVRAAVRRSQTPAADASAVIHIGDIMLDPARRLVEKAGEAVRLTPKEFDLLHYLMSHAGLPVMHARLLHAVWGEEYGGELEYLRTFMRQLRKKLEDDPSSPHYLLTDSHIGYRFREATPEAGALPAQASR